MYPTLRNAKTQNVRVWSKERLIDLACNNQEDGRPCGSSNRLTKGRNSGFLYFNGRGKWEELFLCQAKADFLNDLHVFMQN